MALDECVNPLCVKVIDPPSEPQHRKVAVVLLLVEGISRWSSWAEQLCGACMVWFARVVFTGLDGGGEPAAEMRGVARPVVGAVAGQRVYGRHELLSGGIDMPAAP